MLKPSEVFELSAEFVNSLDRSILGSEATDKEFLTIVDADVRAYLLVDEFERHQQRAQYQRKYSDRELVVLAIEHNTSLDQAFAEVYYWWMIEGDIDMQSFAEICSEQNNLQMRVEQLNLIGDNPDLHDYFAVGIWDLSVAKRLVKDGIDADIALSILGSTEN